MNHREIAGLMAAIAPTIGDFVGKAMAPLRAENARLSSNLAEVEQRFADFSAARANDRVVFLTLVKEEIAKVEPPAIDVVEIERVVNEKVEKAVSALPVPENGKDAEPIDLDEVASRAAKLLPVPENGKDADPEAIKAAVLDVVAEILPGEVSAAVEKIEKPKDGKDVDIAEVAALIHTKVSLAVDGIEKPADGKSVTVDDVRPLLEEMVAALPKPENGKDVDPEIVRAMIVEEVAKIEPPMDGKDGVDGKSVEIEDLISVIAAEVENAVSAIAPPKDGEPGAPGVDGKSVTIEDVRPLLEEMVSALPPAQNGKDADPVEIAALIVEDVAKLIPIPKDGKSITVDEIAPLIEEAAAKRLPNSFLVNEAGILVAVYPNGEPKSVGKVRGEDGLRGASVMDGQVEEDGTLVLRMSDGRIIQTGRVKGDDGKDGDVGQKGERGRDAHEIQILSGVDEHKSYVEGVVALWRGGVIRAERQTDPIVDGDIISAGWKVFVRGIAEEHEDYIEDGRFIERTTVYTDGTEFKRRHKTVTPIHKGVWKEGPYLKGDAVTWAGSTFIALRDNDSEKPEITDAWRLSTKRGRDGKDGRGTPAPISPVKAR